MIRKWQLLFDQLEVIEDLSTKKALDLASLFTFEDENKIILPLEYKNFCQVFGCGIFGGFVRIKCPTPNLVSHWQAIRETLKQDLRQFPAKKSKLKEDEKIVDFLDNAFVFGDDIGDNLLVWDLRTYRKLDQSYDIYWMNANFVNDDTGIYRIGRDFFEFIRDFCLGTQSYEVLPEEEQSPPDLIYPTFTREF